MRHDHGWTFYEGYAFNRAREEERVCTVAPLNVVGQKNTWLHTLTTGRLGAIL